MKRRFLLRAWYLGFALATVLMPVQNTMAADNTGLEEDPVHSAAAPKAAEGQLQGAAPKEKVNVPSQAELDKQRKALRQELLNDRATSVQRQAIAKNKAPESAEEREARQKLYEESASQRGESVLADREALREGQIALDADKLRGLSSWAKGGDGSSSAQQLARLRKQQESRKSISSWASGEDIQEVRRKAREETRQEIIRQLRGED